LHSVLADALAALRSLRQRPRFTIVAVAMLALGTGINAAVFAVIDAALFKGFAHVDRTDRLVQITTNRGFIYYPDFQAWRSGAAAFEDIALVRGVFHTFTDGAGAPETCFATQVTANTFALLHAAPVLGRDFSAADEQPGAEPAVMLRHELWTRRFGASPTVIGRAVRIDGRPARIIGVMPRGFSFPTTQDFWTPLVPTAAALRRDEGYAQYAYGRLRDGVTVERARGDLEAVARRLGSVYPRTNQGLTPVARGFDEWFVAANVKALYKITWAAAAFILLVICANVANVFVEQAAGRSREIAIQLALGADRSRIVRQFLFEGMMLSSLAGVIGWWLARAVVEIYALRQTGSVVLAIGMDRTVVAYLIALTAASACVASLGAAAHLERLNVNGTLTQRSAGIAGGNRGRVQHVFVGVQVALAVLLIAVAVVIARSFLNVYAANVGADTNHLLTMSLYAHPDRYPDAEARIRFYRELTARLESLPGVTSVGFGTAAPAEYTPRVRYEVDGDAASAVEPRPTVAEFAVTAGYFRTLRVDLIAGREFDDRDRNVAAPAAIVNQQFAARHWPGEVPLGRRIRFLTPGRPPTPWLTIVGIVSNVIQNDRTRQVFDPIVYFPYEMYPPPNLFAFVRSAGDPRALLTPIQRQVYALDPNLPVPALSTVADRNDRLYAVERNSTTLVTVFAVVTVLIASLGLYASVSRSVSARITEIGIRRAIGATAADIVTLVFARVSSVVIIGWAVGLALSVAFVRIARAQLIGVPPIDPVALIAASAALAAAAVVGCGIPAARATRVDPAVALRRE
jgi:putative ABC transport system permease protein